MKMFLEVESWLGFMMTRLLLASLVCSRMLLPGASQDRPNATCVFWDEELAKWSSEGVQTLPSEGVAMLVCSTKHLSLFGALVREIWTPFCFWERKQ